MKKLKILILGFIIALSSCEQSEFFQSTRQGDILQFAGRTWEIKHSPDIMPPGNNYFSNHPNDVWVDDNGYLHLSIEQREKTVEGGINEVFWHCTEVVSTDTVGYGTYVWTVEGDLKNLDPEVVLGLFTWDNNTFQEEANSEVDIEFAKWGEVDLDTTLQYGVQPISFGPYNEERVDRPAINPDNWIGVSTHAFTWTDTLITWESYLGDYDQFRVGPPVASWSFDDANPPKIKYEGLNVSDPVVIPAPGNTTNARMNLWLNSGTAGPYLPLRQEIVIRDFQYIPL